MDGLKLEQPVVTILDNEAEAAWLTACWLATHEWG
jgi:hypothetical protein